MRSARRIEIYTKHLKYKTVDGFYRLTPKQRRRLQKKFNMQKRRSGLT